MTLYLDMDGVLADFFSGFAKMNGVTHWKKIQDKEKSIAEIQFTDFFNTLDKCKGADELVQFAREYGDWGINTSPLRGDHYNSAYWKRVWLERNGFMPEVQNLVVTGSKEKYAVNNDGTKNILVDDKPENIQRWNNKGGIGIRYQADEDSLEDLLNELRAILGQ